MPAFTTLQVKVLRCCADWIAHVALEQKGAPPDVAARDFIFAALVAAVTAASGVARQEAA